MKIKSIIVIVSFLGICNIIHSQSYNPYWHDVAKMNQYRAMETGPWDFNSGMTANAWYSLFYPKYKKKYKPSQLKRNFIMVQQNLENKVAEKELDSIKGLRNRELKGFVDRNVDIAYPILETKFKNSESRLSSNIRVFIQNFGYYTAVGNFIAEYSRLMENKKIIKEAHLGNAEKQEAYLKILTEIDNLNATVVAFMRIKNHEKINKYFITKN